MFRSFEIDFLIVGVCVGWKINFRSNDVQKRKRIAGGEGFRFCGVHHVIRHAGDLLDSLGPGPQGIEWMDNQLLNRFRLSQRVRTRRTDSQTHHQDRTCSKSLHITSLWQVVSRNLYTRTNEWSMQANTAEEFIEGRLSAAQFVRGGRGESPSLLSKLYE